MPYIVPWDNTVPAGTAAANQIDTFIQNTKISVSERMQSLGVTGWETDFPVGFSLISLKGTIPYIYGLNAISIRFLNSALTFVNLLINDDGSITVRGIAGFSNGILVTGASNFIGATTFSAPVDVTLAQSHNTEFVNGNSAAAKTIDWGNGNNQSLVLTANCTLTFATPLSAGFYFLRLVQDGTGSRTITWPTVKWGGAVAPTLTVTAAKQDFISFYYDGVSYNGFWSGFNY